MSFPAQLAACVVIASMLPCHAQAGPAPCPGLAEGFSATVAQIVDAETIRLHDGSQLRLAGILTPHADDARAAPNAWAGAVAARAEVEALVLGKTVTLAFGSERRDRYGRHLAHVFIGSDAERVWLQGHLLAQGLARVVTRPQDNACEQAMLRLETAARADNLGLWKDAAYRVRKAQDLDAITALAGTFQIIEGTVTQSRRAGAGVRLDFTERGRFGFSAVVGGPKGSPKANAKGNPRESKKGADAFKGKHVGLRGWLEDRGGRPTLDLTVIGTLELLEPDAATAAPAAAPVE